MLPAVYAAAAEGESHVNELWFEPIWFGVIAAVAFASQIGRAHV